MITRSGTAIATAIVLLTLLLAANIASAQLGRPRQSQQDSGMAVSWAYSGGDNGFRLELGRSDYVIGAGYFDVDDYGARGDGKAYALELGVSPNMFMKGYEGLPFALGVAGYRFTADDPAISDDDSFSLWAGAGDFDHSQKGLFYQYRYIFSGPISGSQGIVGWAF